VLSHTYIAEEVDLSNQQLLLMTGSGGDIPELTLIILSTAITGKNSGAYFDILRVC
jgi:hypothetical protein